MLDWDALYAACMDCQKCALAETRHNVVFGEGPRDAEVMFIGEGPGEQEDLTGRPFVGRAGKLLDDMLAMIGAGFYREYGQVPSAPEPGPAECGAGGLYRLPAQPSGPFAAEDYRMSGPDCSCEAHSGGLQDHPGARPVD